MTSRERFEAWFENDVAGKKVTFPLFEDGEYTEGDLYDDQLYFMLQAMWMAWQAASKASEQQLEESRREFRAADATIHNLEMKVAQLELREHQLSEENETQREFIVEQCFVKFDQGGYCPAVSRMPCVLTATTQFLSNTRASGAEMAGEYLKQYAQGLHEEARLVLQDAGELCNGFAANLRNGDKHE